MPLLPFIMYHCVVARFMFFQHVRAVITPEGVGELEEVEAAHKGRSTICPVGPPAYNHFNVLCISSRLSDWVK